MLTESQHSEIRNYLLTKKLPIDILLEVNDHFVSQINELMREEESSFEESFNKTKESWQSELKLYWNGELDLQDRSKLQRTINRNNFYSLSKKSLSFTIPIILFLFFLSKSLSLNYFKFVFVLIVAAVFLFPILNYFKNRSDFRLFKKYSDYVLISVQEYTLISIGGIYFYFKFFTEGFHIAQRFSEFLIKPHKENIILGVLFTFILLFGSFLAVFSQIIYLQRIEKVKPFLQYLKPSN